MHGWVFLIWAQGLRQAALCATGVMTGTIETEGDISAEEGGSAIFQCRLSSTKAEVTQVNWKKRDQLLAVYHPVLGWHISPGFRERVAPGPHLGLTFKSLTMNDTGEYFCTYYTYPDGIYSGRIFLVVQESSVAGFQMPVSGAVAAVLGVICAAALGVLVALVRKKNSLRIRSVESSLGRMAAEHQELSFSIPLSPGRCVQVDAAPASPYEEQQGDNYEEPPEYFNVLSYRSLGSISFLVETG
uniref:T-cell immunoreceptor with Ig and ITIM domains n=1 Tax=Jaculus jaculus TaxID=51337 RepID=A0A8C5KW25_JACJA